jgi:hypothetical protein
MRHDTDNEPMTPEKAIKLRAHAMIMKMRNAGIPWAHCNIAALVASLELKEQYIKLFKQTKEPIQLDKKEFAQALKYFELLEQGIKGYLPMPKEKKEI